MHILYTCFTKEIWREAVPVSKPETAQSKQERLISDSSPTQSSPEKMIVSVAVVGHQMTMFPEEMLLEILKRLPVKSLCRFRCVSKRWLSIITDPNFVKANFAFSRPKLLISVREVGCNTSKKVDFYSVDLPKQGQPLQLHDTSHGSIDIAPAARISEFGSDSSYSPRRKFSVDFPKQGQPLHATSHGSIEIAPLASISASPSGGLICFTCKDGIRIGNPITGEFELIQTHVSKVFESCIFGFDPIDKNHIILKVDKDQKYVPGLCGKSLLFSINGNQCHEYDIPPHPWIHRDWVESAVCINGEIYFTGWGGLGDKIMGPCLFAYDIKKKNFEMFSRPTNFYGAFEEDERVIEYMGNSALERDSEAELVIDYKGCLALICYGNRHSPSKVDSSGDEVWMWTLENQKWRFKSFLVPWRDNLRRDGIRPFVEYPHLLEVKPFCATPRGELVLASTLVDGGLLYLFLYEIDTDTLRRFDVDGFHRGYLDERVTLNFVMESLESLNGLTKKKQEKKEEKCLDRSDPVET